MLIQLTSRYSVAFWNLDTPWAMMNVANCNIELEFLTMIYSSFSLTLIHFILFQRTRVQVWLFEQTNLRLEGYILVLISFNKSILVVLSYLQ